VKSPAPLLAIADIGNKARPLDNKEREKHDRMERV
jgi:hypothetical protein